VIRVTSDDIRSLPNSSERSFVDPVPDGFPVDNIEEAAKRRFHTASAQRKDAEAIVHHEYGQYRSND
jgi:hypothetical protein